MRVGLLEDDIAIQEMLLMVLQDEGYSVTNYASAADCLQDLGSGKHPLSVDLLIVDWRLSGPVTGIEVIQHLRKAPGAANLPIILTTAATFSDTGVLKHLHVSLLEKPFSVDVMLALIKQLTSHITP